MPRAKKSSQWSPWGALPWCVGVGGINIQTETLTLSEILSEAHKVATS